VLGFDALVAAAAPRAGAAFLKPVENVFHDQSKLQQMTRILTVGALGNDIAVPGIARAADSSAASGRSAPKMSSSGRNLFD
jgi:hypothetical protein